MHMTDRTLVGFHQPPFEERDHAVDSRHRFLQSLYSCPAGIVWLPIRAVGAENTFVGGVDGRYAVGCAPCSKQTLP